MKRRLTHLGIFASFALNIHMVRALLSPRDFHVFLYLPRYNPDNSFPISMVKLEIPQNETTSRNLINNTSKSVERSYFA